MNIISFNNQLLHSCSYLIESESPLLIDCGDIQPIVEYQIQKVKQLKGVFLSHCHHDHIYGLCSLLEKYPDIKVYCSELTAKGLTDDKMNLSYIIPDFPFHYEHDENVVILEQGKQSVEDIEIEVISTPGHSDDCMTYIIGDNIFTGDSYIPFAKVFTKWPRSNIQEALKSEQKLKKMIKERHLNVYPGHWQ